jgi:hypothetical protein
MIDALTIATALGGKKRGRAYWACCPSYAERTPSLKLEDTPDGQVLVKRFGAARCSQESVISAVKSQGLWPGRTEPIDRGELERRRLERIRFEVTVPTDTDFGTWAWWRYVTGPGRNPAARRAAHQES